MQLISAYVAALLVLGVIDATWLSVMGSVLYRPILGDMALESPRIVPAIAFYAMYPIGIVAFAIAPALKADSIMTASLYGLLFGAIAYATYDLTNYATLRNWNLQLTLIDIAYGALATGAAATLATVAIGYLPEWLGGAAG